MQTMHPVRHPLRYPVRAALVALVAPLLAAPLLAAPPLAAQEWERPFWDPAEPVPGQLDLPLPCGARMAFVRVETPVAPGDPLADREIKIGGAAQETGYLDYFRTAVVRGSFTKGEQVFYYLAKYEVTRDQWTAVMDDACPTPSRGGTRPQGGVSWFEAIDFTRRLSEWLRTEAAESLPQEERVYGYLRLPTEAEWEFAARGGAAVDDADFRSALPPMATRLEDHAWFQGRSSANGAYRPMGLKRPNPLGLHEMFGSVEELVLDPFRLNNLGRLHGQIGGFVSRGGSIETPAEELRSALRTEWPFFNAADGRATRFESFGLRPVISAPVNTSLARTTLIRDLWIEGAAAEPGSAADPLAVLDALNDRHTDKRLLEELAFIRGEIVSDRRARDEAAARALRLSLLNGAVVMRWLRQESAQRRRLDEVIGSTQRLLETYRDRLAETDEASRATYQSQVRKFEEELARHQASLERTASNVDLSASAYLTALIDLDETHPDDVVRDQASRLILELAERGQERMAPSVERFVENIARRGAEPGRPREALLDDALQ